MTSLCSKPMELARYFCTGLYEPHDYHHYALNVPLYTHFTSPIRRYPDILVHRLLDIAVRGQKSQWKQDEVGTFTYVGHWFTKNICFRLRRQQSTAMTEDSLLRRLVRPPRSSSLRFSSPSAGP